MAAFNNNNANPHSHANCNSCQVKQIGGAPPIPGGGPPPVPPPNLPHHLNIITIMENFEIKFREFAKTSKDRNMKDKVIRLLLKELREIYQRNTCEENHLDRMDFFEFLENY